MTSLLACLVCVGCVSSHTIAGRVLRAPNQQIKDPREFKRLTAMLTTNFPIQRIAVGPPPATLELQMIEAGDYSATIDSSITVKHPHSNRDPHPYSYDFSFNLNGFSPKIKLGTNDIHGTIFLLHGYGANKEIMLPWALVLAKAGYQVVLVDLRGHGHSTGDRIYFGSVERNDLVQCLDALLQQRVCRGPIGVLGVSYGAVLALQWAAIDPRVQNVVAISPYPDPGTAVEQFLRNYVPSLTWNTDRKSGEEVARLLAAECPDLNTVTAVRQIKRPIFFVRGEQDELCARDDLSRFQAAAPKGSESKEVPLANHFFVGMCISQLGDPVTGWFRDQMH